MPEAHQHPGPRQRSDALGRREFGRQRHHHLPAPRREQQVHQRIVERTEMLGIVNPFARGIDHRPFDMRAEHARYAGGDRCVGRVERP